jgi:hypothetical protein
MEHTATARVAATVAADSHPWTLSPQSGRARRVITPSGRRYRGKFPSGKLQRMVHWESFHERDAILHLEYHPLVERYQEQPSLEWYYSLAGESKKYFPDFQADFEDGTVCLIEVKPTSKLRTAEAKAKYGAIALRLEEQGRQFRILTEADIHRQPLFSNLQRLHECRRQRVADVDSHMDLETGCSLGEIVTFGALARRLGGEERVLYLLGTGELRTDLESELGENSPIALAGTEGGPDGAFRI